MARRPAFDHEHLMAAAYDVLREHGPGGLALRPIAARLGVSQPALSKRVGSKQKLLFEMQRWASDKTERLIAAMRDRGPRDGLRWLFHIYGRQARSPRELVHLVSFAALCLAEPALRRYAESRRRRLTAAITAALRHLEQPRPAPVARTLVALLDGVPLAWAIEPRGALDRALLESLDLVLGARSTPPRATTGSVRARRRRRPPHG